MSQKLVSLNRNDYKRRITLDRLDYPFNLIKQSANASLSIKQDDMNSRVFISSDKPFDIIDEEMIKKSFLKDE